MTVNHTSHLGGLQGTWSIIASTVDGVELPAVAFASATVVVNGDHFTSLGMGAPYEGTMSVDETRTPKRFDLLFTVGHAAGVRNLGIYKLEGDRWTICLATRGARPRSFVSKSESGVAVQTLERRSMAEPPPGREEVDASRADDSGASKAPVGTEDSTVAPPTVIEGGWAMVSGVFNGVAMADGMVQWAKRTTRGDMTTVMAGDRLMLHARFTLDQSCDPAGIDYVNVAGAHAGKSQAGIYALRGETLEICMAPPGQPRPTDFASRAKDGRSYTCWRLESADGASGD